MKKLSFRILAVMIVALMILGLAACGKKDAGEVSTTGAGLSWEELLEQLPEGAENVTLEVYDWTPENEYTGLPEANAAFTSETGIGVKFNVVPYDSYFTKINTAVAANNGPDVVRVQNGARKEMTYLQPMNTATTFDYTDAEYWDQTVVNHYTYKGNIYAVNMVNTPVYSPYVMYYNKALISKYELDDPYDLWKANDGSWNWDTVFDMCETFLDEVGDDSYSGLITMAGFEYWQAAGVPPITFDRESNTFSHNFKNTTFQEVTMKFVRKNDDGLMDKQLSNTPKFNGGKALFGVFMGQLTNTTSVTFKDLRASGSLACVPLPSFDDKTDDVQVMGEVLAMGIPKTAKNAQLVPFYLRYVLDRNNYDMANYYGCDHAEETMSYIAGSNPVAAIDSYVITKDDTGFNANTIIDEFRGSGVANVVSRCDMFAPAVEAGIAKANAFYAGL